MKLVIGLGNPGPEYAQTWHNIGWLALDEAHTQLKAGEWKTWGPGSNSLLSQGQADGEKVLLLKPLTYMNLSGQAAVAAAHYFKVLPEDILAIHDDLDLPLGDVRLKTGGGDGGHNGLKSLTKSLATNEYCRVRMGIGRPPHAGMDPRDYVLSQIKDWTLVGDMVHRSFRGIQAFLSGPEAFGREMNQLNRKRE